MQPIPFKIKVREIFYSLQGEGARAGEASIFIRLAKCNLNCWFCDTDWSYGTNMTPEEILKEISNYNCKWIIWTGGEPTLQLTDELAQFFKAKGYKQAIETNGTNRVSKFIDYVTVSPKPQSPPEVLNQNFPRGVDEIRYPISRGDIIPKIEDLPPAQNYFVSPVFLGTKKQRFELEKRNVLYCIDYVKENPGWRMSIQQHKIWGIR